MIDWRAATRAHERLAPRNDRLLLSFALAKLAVQLSVIRGYGYFRDELYYLACSDRLAWGYVDHPPLSIVLLRGVRVLLGDSLPALRLLPALAGAATVWLAGWICWRMRGGPIGQALAMTAAIGAPVLLGANHVYSMNAFDVLFWTLAAAILVRVFDDGDAKLWLLLGVVLGLGLMNKISVLWLGFGLVIGLRFTQQRGWLTTKWPWLAGTIAFAIFAPHVAWQVQRGWPTLEFMRNAVQIKMQPITPPQFLLELLLELNPAALPVWLGGLAFLLLAPAARKHRPLALMFLVILALLMAFRSVRPSYLAAAAPMLFAAGGAAIGRISAQLRGRWLAPGLLSIAALGGVALAPMALPILPVASYVRYATALRVSPGTNERLAVGPLPQHFADMFGWEALADAVARAYEGLPPEDRRDAALFVQNYGEAGAVEFFGRSRGLPTVLCPHNTYWYWGSRSLSAKVLVVLGGDEQDNRENCRELEKLGSVECGSCMPYENGRAIYLCRLRAPLSTLWPRLKRFI